MKRSVVLLVAIATSLLLALPAGGTGGVYRVDRADDLGWLYASFAKYLPRR